MIMNLPLLMIKRNNIKSIYHYWGIRNYCGLAKKGIQRHNMVSIVVIFLPLSRPLQLSALMLGESKAQQLNFTHSPPHDLWIKITVLVPVAFTSFPEMT